MIWATPWDLGHTLVVGLPQAKRYHDAARLSVEDHARLDRVLTAVIRALPLGLPAIGPRVFGKSADAPGIDGFVRAATLLRDGRDNADLRGATDALGRAALDIGLDHFKGLLRQADDHIAGQGGLLTLVRDVPRAPPPLEAPVGLPLPRTLGSSLRLGLFGLAPTVLSAIVGYIGQQNFEEVVREYHLDVSKPEDVVAASAYLWAEIH